MAFCPITAVKRQYRRLRGEPAFGEEAAPALLRYRHFPGAYRKLAKPDVLPVIRVTMSSFICGAHTED